jgi:predicted DNA-binding transcriptional regulator AlpA
MTPARSASRVVPLRDDVSPATTVDLDQPTIDAREVAVLLRVNVDTVYDLIRSDEMPSGLQPIKVGRLLRWPTQRVVDALGLGPVC